MKQWVSAQELDTLAPALGKERAVQYRATREGWQSRPRQGQGCAEPHALRLKKIMGFCGFLWVFWQSKASRIWFAQKTVECGFARFQQTWDATLNQFKKRLKNV